MVSNEVGTFWEKSFIGNFSKLKRRKEIISDQRTKYRFLILATFAFVPIFAVASASASGPAPTEANVGIKILDGDQIRQSDRIEISYDDKHPSQQDEYKNVAKFFDAGARNDRNPNDVASTNVKKLVDSGSDKLRKRRLSGESAVMSFYRPTKKVFASAVDAPVTVLEGKQKRHENEEIDDVKMSTVEMTSPTFENDAEHSFGGISHFSGN
jgi:hypothetical protein